MTHISIPYSCNKKTCSLVNPCVTFELKDGSKYKLRTIEELQQHGDPDREVVLVFCNKVFFGYSRGKIDSTGDLIFKSSPDNLWVYGLPSRFFIGWAYRSDKIG